MPFPSGRCKTCRARHVKCDEYRPICTQCSRTGRMCTWDESDPGGLFFRDENDFASSRAKRRRGGARGPAIDSLRQRTASPSLAGRQRSSTPVSLTSQTLTRSSSTLSLRTQPSECIETKALNNFVHRFINTEEHLDADVWGFLHDYRSDFFPLQSHATFDPAVMAYALAHFGRTNHDPTVIAASRRYYSQALVNTNHAVQCESSALADEVALTAVLLSGYEDLLGNFDPVKLQSQGFSHLKGVTALLRAREQYGELSERSENLNRFIRRRVIRSSISHGAAVTLLIQEGQLHNSQPICDTLYRCLVSVAVVRNKAISTLRRIICLPPKEQRSQLPKVWRIVKAVQEVDDQLEAWRSCLPSDWQYEVHNASNSHHEFGLSSGIFYSRIYHTCSDRTMHPVWNNYRAARLVTLGILRKIACMNPYICQMLVDHYAFDFGSNMRTMCGLVEDIAATIPVHFNAIGDPPRTREELIQRTPVSTAFHLVWPLIIASATQDIPNQLRDWVKSMLLLVSQIAGSAVLEMLAGMNLHTHLGSYPQSKQK